ncbi:MAG TPA: hypothetical protein PK153_26235 [Leptospiraceae bacterium]|nr:hypothetical protein [Leptospiraceae bacterium]HNH58331.1 hypothetical protein [Leptospiraceae bacterium]
MKIMARYKEIEYKQSLLLAVNYSEQIIEGTFEHALCYLFDEGKIDAKIFDIKYKNDIYQTPKETSHKDFIGVVFGIDRTLICN